MMLVIYKVEKIGLPRRYPDRAIAWQTVIAFQAKAPEAVASTIYYDHHKYKASGDDLQQPPEVLADLR
ncbi:hypothetical protein D3C76_1854840 [compost metagenome]